MSGGLGSLIAFLAQKPRVTTQTARQAAKLDGGLISLACVKIGNIPIFSYKPPIDKSLRNICVILISLLKEIICYYYFTGGLAVWPLSPCYVDT